MPKLLNTKCELVSERNKKVFNSVLNVEEYGIVY